MPPIPAIPRHRRYWETSRTAPAPQGPHLAADGAQSWLDKTRPHQRTLDDPFVELPWSETLDLLAGELSRVHRDYGASAIYGGSYGWASAGRFHHAQSQVHRFLNIAFGGYVRSVNSYSAGASAVILPHILGPFEGISRRNVTWEQICEHTRCGAGVRRHGAEEFDGRERRNQPPRRA